MNEIWKDINGYQGVYQVSNLGRVRSFTKKSNGKLLIPIKTKKGYLTVRLYNKDGFKHLKIHRLVALTFINNPMSKKQVNHINGIKTDNTIENLEWCGNQENQRHAFDIGLNKNHRGEKAKNVKLTQQQVDEIRDRYIFGKRGLAKLLSKEYNISTHTIRAIWYGGIWN